MKVLVVLVLAVFTGCNANILYADAPKPQIELLTEVFLDYVAKATETADDTLQMINKSPFFQGVNEHLEETKCVAAHSLFFMHEMLPPASQDMFHKVIREAKELKGRVERELAAAQDIMKPYTDNMEVQIQQRVEQLKQKLAPYAESIDTEAVRATLEQKSEELKQSVKDLQAQLGPYIDDLKLKVDQHLQDFQERVAPVAERVQDQLIQKAIQVRDMAAPYVEDLRVNLNPYSQDLQARLTSLYEANAKSK
ncbi:apolipoprotein A-I-like [Gymnodraco acuticeps]|uniref:Apolipoprotein A-I-like n=1 Tax=Gymnodraco acuticeps TaxID=8218 RepID=A0A6P8VGQ0_GYMAC|nr:apolipoprotein A-I-like [Gymnodraco acuticeps]